MHTHRRCRFRALSSSLARTRRRWRSRLHPAAFPRRSLLRKFKEATTFQRPVSWFFPDHVPRSIFAGPSSLQDYVSTSVLRRTLCIRNCRADPCVDEDWKPLVCCRPSQHGCFTRHGIRGRCGCAVDGDAWMCIIPPSIRQSSSGCRICRCTWRSTLPRTSFAETSWRTRLQTTWRTMYRIPPCCPCVC